MDPDRLTVTRTYLEHLSPHDLALACPEDVARIGVPGTRAQLASDPDRLERALGADALFERVFSHDSGDGPLLGASPFLVFAVCVERAAAELTTATYVAEWLGPGRRAPVFDVDQLPEFLAFRRRRLFLTELLASYTHVRSGSVVQLTRRGLRRHRFSELDPVRLASDAGQRAGTAPTWAREATEPVGLLSQLGPRWYRAAFDLIPRPVPADLVVVGELAERFSQARRVLSFITERFLFPHRETWFGLAAG